MSKDFSAVRSAFLEVVPEAKIVTWKGHDLEVRRLSLGETQRITKRNRNLKSGEIDEIAVFVDSVIASCYHVGADKRVFEPADKDVLLSMSAVKSQLGEIAKAMKDLATDEEKVEELFEKAQSEPT